MLYVIFAHSKPYICIENYPDKQWRLKLHAVRLVSWTNSARASTALANASIVAVR
jgi:hypothetical protein